ncbi:hypothetical protein [Rhizomicrobium electricum]|nr:hypothetical protein [Rhizomicrobium electricum]
MFGRLVTPRTGLIASIAAHALIGFSMLTAWPHLVHTNAIDVPVIPVELVTIGDDTNFAPVTRDWLPYRTADVARAPAAPAVPPETAPSFEMKLFPTKPVPPPTIGTEVKGTTPDARGHALTPTSAPADARAGDYNIIGVGDKTASMLSVLDALHNAIARCWVRSSIRTPQTDAVIVFELHLNRDGTVAKPPQLKSSDASGKAEDLRSQTEALRRAIYTCAPYQLPLEKYAIWQHAIVTFDTNKLPR